MKRSLTPRSIKIGTEIVSSGQMNDINNSLKSTSYKKPFPYHHENPMVPDGETFVKPKINMSGVTTDITDQETVAIRGFYENLITKGSNAPAGLSLWQAVPNSPNSQAKKVGWHTMEITIIFT